MAGGWPNRLRERELGAARGAAPLPPAPNGGVLILDDRLAVDALPGGPLAHVTPPPPGAPGVHYLDLGGVQARSLLNFGGTDAFWAGITKLYASGSGLTSADGMARLASCRYLYLDKNRLPAHEVARIAAELPPGAQLLALDVSGNPGATAETEAALAAAPALAGVEFLNGRRLRRGGT